MDSCQSKQRYDRPLPRLKHRRSSIYAKKKRLN